MSSHKKILLGQLGAYGDCLYVTTIARQIKSDYPGCHLTWAIGSAYSSIIANNPYVDKIWEIPIANHRELWEKWDEFEKKAQEAKNHGDFDLIFLTQIPPKNFKNFDSTVRTSLFRAYPNPITVRVTPILRLSEKEIQNVKLFAKSYKLESKKHVILFECSSHSSQSFVTDEFAYEFAIKLVSLIPELCIILSSNKKIQLQHERIIDASCLSFRENAELTKYCTLLIGCSSGISWLCTSDWAKKLQMVQLLEKDRSIYASFIHDYLYRGESIDHIIEMTNCSTDKLLDCILCIFNEDFKVAKSTYSENIKITFSSYSAIIYNYLLKTRKYKDAFISIKNTVNRFGVRPNLFFWIFIQLIRHIIMSVFNFDLIKLRKLFSHNI